MCFRTLFCISLAASACRASLLGRDSPSQTSSVFSAPTPTSASTVNSSDHDLSKHFCRIYRHASVFADGKIYIDGGNTYIPKFNGTFSNTDTGNWTKGMNDQLLVLDLSQNFTNQDTFPYSTILKNPDVPNGLIEGTLWYSAATRKIYQLGGWFSFNSQTDPGFVELDNIPESAIWEFDIDSKVWSKLTDFEYVGLGTKIDRPGAAAYCDAPSLNKSFIFEGYVQQRSDHDYITYAQSKDFKFLEGMLVLDTGTAVTKPTLTNTSVPVSLGDDKNPFGPRMNGAMVHVPIGDKGILVFLGGQVTVDPTSYGVQIEGANAGNDNIQNDFVDIYDIKTGFWFRQKTFGTPDIPTGRSDICSVVVPAKDNSSYNIYMVAGVENYSSYMTSEEIWVLSLPTFQWVLVHSRADGMYGHTCHAVGENLLILGGMQTQKSGGDVQTCSSHMPAEIFDLVTQNYTGIFNAEGATRQAPVPSQVVSAIGGAADGGAYKTSPLEWSDTWLQYVLNPSLEPPKPYVPPYQLVVPNKNDTGGNGTEPPSGSKSGSNKGALIGGVVGGVVGGLILLALVAIFFIVRRRKRKEAQTNRQRVQSQMSEMPDSSAYGYDKKQIYNAPPPQMQMEPAELPGPVPASEMSGSPVPSYGSPSPSPDHHRSVSPQSQAYEVSSYRDSRISNYGPY